MNWWQRILLIGLVLTIPTTTLVRGDDAKPEVNAEAKEGAKPAEPPKPDPNGEKTGDASLIGDKPKLVDVDPKQPDIKALAENSKATSDYLQTVADFSGKNRTAINMMWTLLAGFLVMFMQAGFAMVETGLTRAKNVAHTMAMNFMVYGIGMIGFYIAGFAIMFGGFNSEALGGGFLGGDANLLTSELKIHLFGKDFGILGYNGFFLTGSAYDVGILSLFLFQMVFMDTTATIPTGTMAERWRFLPFVIYGFFVSMVIYPVYGNWVWGGGWLSKLGSEFNLGHGHVDFAGSSVVHMVGGVTALAGGLIIGPRIGKYNKDGTPNPLPAHNVPMYMIGTFILAFGWFGFNAGSTLAGADSVIGRAAANTMLASAAGALTSMVYMWLVYKKPDPSFMCNGMLAGLVAITAPCAFVAPWAAVVIGGIAGVLVIWSCLFVEKTLKVDDPVGAISVHGVNGAWGVLALGLFADGTYGTAGWNGVFLYEIQGKLQWMSKALSADEMKTLGATVKGVTGLFYGNPSQFLAEAIGAIANVLWVFPVAYGFFWVLEKVVGNRVKPEDEVEGLDIPEMGVQGYINEETQPVEGTAAIPVHEPRPAAKPPNGVAHFVVKVQGASEPELMNAWSELCKPNASPPSTDFLAVYPRMTTVSGFQFHFRAGDPKETSVRLVKLLQERMPGKELSGSIVT